MTYDTYIFNTETAPIDLHIYSLLPDGLVSMLTYFSMSGADKDYIPMFSWTNLFLAVLRLNNKVILNPTKHMSHDLGTVTIFRLLGLGLGFGLGKGLGL